MPYHTIPNHIMPYQESLCYEVFQERSNKYKVGNLVSSNDLPEMLEEVNAACESAVLKNLLQKINKGAEWQTKGPLTNKQICKR